MKQREKRQMGKPTSRCSSFRRSKLSVAAETDAIFYSPKGTGLYFSLVTSPKSDLTSAVGITSYAAVCVVEAIKELTGTDTKIKWVNDIYLDGKKLCGILTEAVSDFETGTVSNIIIGIGINLKTATLPDSLKDKVGFFGIRFTD